MSSHPAQQLGAEVGLGDPSSPSASSTSCPAGWPLLEMAVPCTLGVLLTFPRQGDLLKPGIPRLQELRASQEGTPCTGLLSPQVSPRAGCRAGTGLAPQHPPIARGEEMLSPGGGVEKRGPCWKERVGASRPRRAAPALPAQPHGEPSPLVPCFPHPLPARFPAVLSRRQPGHSSSAAVAGARSSGSMTTCRPPPSSCASWTRCGPPSCAPSTAS